MAVFTSMDFGQQIKSIRSKENVSQSQFALKLNVSRQAVSNWENNKNLPDIGLLIHMSEIFNLSLDYLIKGEDQMNNMTEKVIRDGSETQKAKYNMITTMTSAFMVLIGIILLVIKGLSVEYVDANGSLHENFFLIPLAYLSIFCGLIGFLAMGFRRYKDRDIN